MYEKEDEEAISLVEVHLYGSTRLGMVTQRSATDSLNIALSGVFGTAKELTFTRTEKIFELSNHLGSVLATVSDKNAGIDNNNDGTIDYYETDVISTQDFYPFGQFMPGRQFGTVARYGFNGKEQDAEVKGTGAQYDYGFRIYDPRIGRFLSVDPLSKSFPWNSPYSYAEGDVIRSIDLDGLEKYVVTYWYDNKGNHRQTTIKAIRAQDSREIVDMNLSTANGGDLTDKDVWVRKLYFDGRQKEAATGKAVLNASERALFGRAVTVREKAPNTNPTIYYDLGDEKGGASTQSGQFGSKEYEFREASQDIALISNLNPSFNNATFYYADPGSGVGTLMPKDEAIGIDKGIKEFYDLPSKIKDDGGITSIDIVMTYYVSDKLSDREFGNLQNAFNQVASQVKDIYSASGVKNINVNTVVERRRDFQQANTNAPDIQITLKR